MTLTSRGAIHTAVTTAAIAGIGLLAGCSAGGNTASQPPTQAASGPMTQQQAAARAQQILRDTASGVQPPLRLRVDPDMTMPSECNTQIPRVSVTYAFFLSGLTESQEGTAALKIRAYWKKRGYNVGISGGFTDGQPYIAAETQDHFLIGLDWNTTGGPVFISATSPCAIAESTAPSS